jgi:hypothetical protein
MIDAQRFPFTERLDEFGTPDAVPSVAFNCDLPKQFDRSIRIVGYWGKCKCLPHDVGVRLGAVWEEQTTSVLLAGNLAPVEARGLVVSAEIRPFAPIRLVFAWSQTNDVPLLLGRMNFFLEFDVCFY